MIIYVDIDETICYYKKERNYNIATPIQKNIDTINNLYDEGNMIVYWTSRGSQTGIDWLSTTTKQLDQWNAKHHKLIMGKPHYDLFICDKAIDSESFFNNRGKR